MHFKHPELFYALVLLVIPVLVHLFQLRRFQKEDFTNVKFLKKSLLQSRKSSRIKKWLLLASRLLVLGFLIMAFTQPFIPASRESMTEQEVVIYLDNSYSMQTNSHRGVFLKRGIQDLLESLPEDLTFSLFTNDEQFKDTNILSLRKDLQQISYSPDQLDWQTVKLKAESLFSKKANNTRNFIAVSDFQITSKEEKLAVPGNMKFYPVRLSSNNFKNVWIDSAFISKKNFEGTEISIRFHSSGASYPQVPVSVFRGDELLGKKMISINKDSSITTGFQLPPYPIEDGYISLDDNSGLDYDNKLYFSVNKSEAIKVVSINGEEDSFLKKIFNTPEFEYDAFREDQIDFIKIEKANLIILNEVKGISSALSASIKNLLREKVYLIFIPSSQPEPESYDLFFKNLNLPLFSEKVDQGKLITSISFSHPLYQPVFEEEVENFQYPGVSSYYPLKRKTTPVLGLENGHPFLFTQNNIFVFTSPLNSKNSNFQHSPLIVPTFINMGNMSLRPTPLYYQIGKSSTIDVQVSLRQDEILKLVSSVSSFIPLQQRYRNKVEIQVGEVPDSPGCFTVQNDSLTLKNLGFNIDRTESRLGYLDLKDLEGHKNFDHVQEAFQSIKSESNKTELWKWFVIFALFFLVTEIVILKYFK